MSDHPPIAVTEQRLFCAPDDQPILAVNAGLPVSDDLQLASTLLGGATRLVMNGCDEEEDSTLIQYLLESSKTLLDASLSGIWAQEAADFGATYTPMP